MMLPLRWAGAQTLSVTGRCRYGTVMESACSSGSRSRWSIMLTFQKNVCITPQKQTSADCDVIVCLRCSDVPMSRERRTNDVPLAQRMSAVQSSHRLPLPSRVIRAYQTSGHLPAALQHAFVLTRPTIWVGTSAHAICGLILTLRRVCHRFCR
jgi:hypothetical protein